MTHAPSSPEPVLGGEPVTLFLVGRTLRGTLGEAFRAEAVALFEAEHPGVGTVRSALSRTVELTAVVVGRAAALDVDAVIADPAFGRRMRGAAPGAGRQVFEVVAESVEGIEPIRGPAGTDRSRLITVGVASEASLGFSVRVVRRD